LGKKEVCAKWIPHVLDDDHRTMCVLFATTHLQLWKKEGIAFVDHILTVDGSWMHSFDPQLKRQIAEWHAKKLLRKKIVRGSQGALKVMHIMFFSRNDLAFDHPVLLGTTVSGHYYCALLPDKIRRCLRYKQPELLEHGVILLWKIQLIAIVLCKIFGRVGAGRCWESSVLSRSRPI
jgi:hypothetical protein